MTEKNTQRINKSLSLICLMFTSILITVFSCKKIDLNRINKISTDNVSILFTDVNASGTIIDVGKGGISKFGHCWSTSTIPTINDFRTEFDGAIAGKTFTSQLSGLSVNQIYFIRSYACNANETVYGEIKKISVSNFGNISITSDSLKAENETSISVIGNISKLGSLKLLDYGHCWATHSMPTLADNKSLNGVTTIDQKFSSLFTGLNLQTTYYVRAFVILDNSTVIYSNELSILIPDLLVTTDNYSLSGSTATLQGAIVSLGFLPVLDYGHCWSYTSSNPNINDNVISKGATGAALIYYSNLSSLIPGTTYYFRAYARKGNTFKYGTVKSFKYL